MKIKMAVLSSVALTSIATFSTPSSWLDPVLSIPATHLPEDSSILLSSHAPPQYIPRNLSRDHWTKVPSYSNTYQNLPVRVLILFWEDVGSKILNMFSPSIPQRFLWRHNLNFSSWFILFISECCRERRASLSPVFGSIRILRRSNKFIRRYKIVELFDIFKLPSDFVWKHKLYSVACMQVDSFNHILKVPFMYDPSRKDFIIRSVPNISRPIMMGRLAGNVRYPESLSMYKGCFW